MIVDIDEVVHETAEAYLVRIDRLKYWVPKSKTQLLGDIKDNTLGIDLPEWLAEDKGLI